MNDGRIDLIRLTIRSEKDAAVLRDDESARVLCSATCIIVEFADGASGPGRAAFQNLLEDRCVALEGSLEGPLEDSAAEYLATEVVAEVDKFVAACRKQKDGDEDDVESSHQEDGGGGVSSVVNSGGKGAGDGL